ncbi:MAG: hypothetical protein IKF68_03580 [Erysipelotrichaceae bacterium]|nr:hypothetical protein [Erysipelotrichaceae bacterium]
MGGYLMYIMMLLVIFMLFSNMRKAKAMRKDERYISCYTAVLRDEEKAAEELEAYVNEETDPELLNKSLIVKVYTDILSGKDPHETIEKIDLSDVFLVKGEYVPEKVSRNSDAFVWLLLDLSKARSESMIDVMDKLYEKISAYEDRLGNHVEYLVLKATYNALLEKDLDGIRFLNKLLTGEYADYVYDKSLVGVFKKVAAAILIYTGEPISEEDEMLLNSFVETQVGHKFLTNLGIADKYMKKEEAVEETVTEEEEIKETAEETADTEDVTEEADKTK